MYMDIQTVAKEKLAKRIAGEIVLSSDPGKTIQKWRNIFKIPQRKLAGKMSIMPSVISDYENGRRKSPGIRVIKRIVDAMIDLDEKSGGKIIMDFSVFPTKPVLFDAVLDMKEFGAPVSIRGFCKNIDADILVRSDLEDNKIYGYTVIDGMKAILEIPPTEMVRLYGLTTERALIFTGAHRGRSSMVAIKVTNLNPGLVIFQGSEKLDELAKRIGSLEGIPIGLTKIKNASKLINILKEAYSR